MMTLGILPGKAVSAPRRALLLTVIAWMNIAMAPCAMAFGDAPGCLHGAAQANSAGMAHHGGHERHGAKSEASTGTDCGTVGNDCCATQNNSATDSRGQKSVDAGNTDCMPPPDPFVFSISSADFAMCRAVDRPPWRFATSPPVHVLNCVYRI